MSTKISIFEIKNNPLKISTHTVLHLLCTVQWNNFTEKNFMTL